MNNIKLRLRCQYLTVSTTNPSLKRPFKFKVFNEPVKINANKTDYIKPVGNFKVIRKSFFIYLYQKPNFYFKYIIINH